MIIGIRHFICFNIPDHEIMSHTVAIMEEHRCFHFQVIAVHVMNTFGHCGKNSLSHVFPKIFLIILLKRHPNAGLVRCLSSRAALCKYSGNLGLFSNPRACEFRIEIHCTYISLHFQQCLAWTCRRSIKLPMQDIQREGFYIVDWQRFLVMSSVM